MPGAFTSLPDENLSHIKSIVNDEPTNLPPLSKDARLIDVLLACLGQRLDITFCTINEKQSENMSVASYIKDVAKRSGVHAKAIQLEPEWYKKDMGTLLVFDEKNQVGVIYCDVWGKYFLIQDTTGQPRPMTEDDLKSFQSTAFTFFRSFRSDVLTFKSIVQMALGRVKADAFSIGFTHICFSLIALATPFFTGKIMDDVLPQADLPALRDFMILLVALSIMGLGFKVINAISFIRLTAMANMDTQSAIWSRVLSMPMSFFRSFTIGDLADRAQGVIQILETITAPVFTGLLNGAFAIFPLIAIFYYDVTVGLWVTLYLIVVFLMFTGLLSNQLGYMRTIVAKGADNANIVFQYINGIKKLRTHAREKEAFLTWSAHNRDLVRTMKQLEWNLILLKTLDHLFFLGFIMFGLYLMYTNLEALSIGAIVALNGLFGSLYTSVRSLINASMSCVSVVPQYERFSPIETNAPESNPQTHVNHSQIPDLSGPIKIQNLSFAYRDDQEDLYKNVDMTFEAGAFTAIIGPSGCGKSTLLRLLLGFEKPKTGKIYYGSQALSQMNRALLRSQIGTIVQNSALPNVSLRDAIRGDRTDIGDDDIWLALAKAAMAEDVMALPMGLETPIDENAQTFSKGQRQRLLIAKIFLQSPQVVFLDEATSALDNQHQAHIQNSFEDMKATRVVIAHRLSTFKNADYIYMIDPDSRQVIGGTFEHLANTSNKFKEKIIHT